jgi:hypothetical protein
MPFSFKEPRPLAAIRLWLTLGDVAPGTSLEGLGALATGGVFDRYITSV